MIFKRTDIGHTRMSVLTLNPISELGGTSTLQRSVKSFTSAEEPQSWQGAKPFPDKYKHSGIRQLLAGRGSFFKEGPKLAETTKQSYNAHRALKSVKWALASTEGVIPFRLRLRKLLRSPVIRQDYGNNLVP